LLHTAHMPCAHHTLCMQKTHIPHTHQTPCRHNTHHIHTIHHVRTTQTYSTHSCTVHMPGTHHAHKYTYTISMLCTRHLTHQMHTQENHAHHTVPQSTLCLHNIHQEHTHQSHDTHITYTPCAHCMLRTYNTPHTHTPRGVPSLECFSITMKEWCVLIRSI
jgi:hypothetical protein